MGGMDNFSEWIAALAIASAQAAMIGLTALFVAVLLGVRVKLQSKAVNRLMLALSIALVSLSTYVFVGWRLVALRPTAVAVHPTLFAVWSCSAGVFFSATAWAGAEALLLRVRLIRWVNALFTKPGGH